MDTSPWTSTPPSESESDESAAATGGRGCGAGRGWSIVMGILAGECGEGRGRCREMGCAEARLRCLWAGVLSSSSRRSLDRDRCRNS